MYFWCNFCRKENKTAALNKLYTTIVATAFMAILLSCAKIGTPPGGPKDETPPVVVKSKPGNYSTDYNRRNILITFDEYVTLKNAFTEFTISPPLEKNPVPYTRGKSVVIDLPTGELDSVTYTMDFGESIADNNEGNKLENFQFVISKQAHVDSFSVSGKVLNAFTQQPEEGGVFVYLNRNLNDTVPYTTIPSYLGKTDKTGAFNINHISPGTYSVFVLKDANANFIYDMPSELIGFADEPITLHPDSFNIAIAPVVDSIQTDSLIVIADSAYTKSELVSELSVNEDSIQVSEPAISEFSTQGDSLRIDAAITNSIATDSTATDSIEFMVYGYAIDLVSFIEEEPQKQFLSEFKRTAPDQINLIFNTKADSLPKLKLLNNDTLSNWYLVEKNKTLDTLNYWLPDSSLISNDSLVVAVFYEETDSLGALVPTIDTLLLRAKIKEKKSDSPQHEKGINLGFGKKDEEAADTLPEPIPRVAFSTNINNSKHDLYRSIVIVPEVPTFEYNPELIEFFQLEDTIEVRKKFTFENDSAWLRKAVIKTTFETETSYILRLHEGAFTDIYGRTIDSTEIRFKTQDEEHYGIVEVSLSNITSPTILQLLDKSENVVKYARLYNNKKTTFDFLEPGEYLLKIIMDDNDNGKWDTGILDEKKQPEKVYYYPETLNVRSNWTIDYEWEIGKKIEVDTEKEAIAIDD